ncbi:MAG: Tim44/TimA family putative adaptor protein [Novosphingopyxis baekryungensis]|uniref:Tim44/TimA family putative adaptor protein n=1 Tax=Novosphingopyxis baekryungensis TaxID=279369 RepID=UPI000491EEB6|nr:Tim44/TimA family putative adaptor protein [Novosphingopyxis baekryungensis]MDE0932505.1 Tim44/TimA family putative adaptor protein [Novosphingopyxis baekryungensis]
MTPEMIILALLAGFLGLRLYSVLGKRTGHEQEPMPRRVEESPRAPAAQPQRGDDKREGAAPVEDIPAVAGAGRDLAAIGAADRDFDPARFVEGAKSAYRMVLEAFWSGDRDTVDFLTDDEVGQSFISAIDAREERGETLEHRLVRIEDAKILEADYRRPIARVTIQFDADIAALVRDKDGNVIGGSMTDAVEAHDIWTFQRDVTSNDPNWTLVETATV